MCSLTRSNIRVTVRLITFSLFVIDRSRSSTAIDYLPVSVSQGH